jgi:hypothetical protein
MNPHFQSAAPGDDREQVEHPLRIPKRAYGRVDHVVLPRGLAGRALLGIDLVDADWLDGAGQADSRFSLADSSQRSHAWGTYIAKLGGPIRPSNPFESAPLFRLEIELPFGDSWFGMPPLPAPQEPYFDASMEALESQWLEFYDIKAAAPGEVGAALLYPSLFADPITVRVEGKLPTVSQGMALSQVFSLQNAAVSSTSDIESLLAATRTDLLSVFDVGQGNANAFVNGACLVSLYYDLGAGVYRNKKTTPPGLTFCFTGNPAVVLSHWDTDHWAGTYATSVAGAYPALKCNWIAPNQSVGPTHVAFAHDIATNGGSLRLYTPPPGTLGTATTASGHTARFTVGSGRDRNGTGIVLAIENHGIRPAPVCWMLTGDCDYRHFLPSLTACAPVAIVVPHHGADLHPSTTVPWPTRPSGYCRLAYSFGRDNSHGSTGVQHPTPAGVQAHDKAGWVHGAWSLMAPGMPTPGPELVATCEHSPGTYRGGAVVGWSSPPAPYGLPCGGSFCTASVVQS